MKRQLLTRYYPGKVCPARAGLYQLRGGWAYWDGRRWFVWALSEQGATRNWQLGLISPYQGVKRRDKGFEWRGTLKEAA